MSCAQLVTPNLDPYVHQNGGVLTDWYGWCLAVVQAMYGVGWAGSNAWEAWNDHVNIKHLDRDIPAGMYVPIWFSGYHDLGHVAIYKDGQVWSSPWHHKPYADVMSSIEEVERIYGVSYVGWSEDIGGTQVVEFIPNTIVVPESPPPTQESIPIITPESTPPPSPTSITPPVTASSTAQYSLIVPVPYYPSPGNAVTKINGKGTLANGAYYIFNQQQGMYSLTKTLGQSQGTWINPADNVVKPPAPIETTADIQKSFKWFFPTHEPVTYKVLQDLSVQDVVHGSTPVPLSKGREVEIYGTFQAKGGTYLRPLTGLDDKGMYSFYGIKTTDIYSGAPYLDNEYNIADIVSTRWESFYDKAIKTIEGIFKPRRK